MPQIFQFPQNGIYDFVVCGAGSAGCVVARRLAESGEARVLLIEAGGSDDRAEVMDPAAWTQNIGSNRDWKFEAEPNAAIDGRALPLSMGKVLGGGSSINGLMWIRGHREDWDGFAAAAGDPAWGYEHVRRIYDRIEGRDQATGESAKPVKLQSANPNDGTPLLVEAAASLGIPTFDNPNGRMMELNAAAATMDVIVKDGRRRSMYQAYIRPILDIENVDVLTGATVAGLDIGRGRVEAVKILLGSKLSAVRVHHDVVLSLGAIQTPKVLFQSGIGDAATLKRLGIPLRQHLPGVGRNFQDHVMLFGVAWEIAAGRSDPNASRAVVQHASNAGMDRPDLQILQSSGGTIRREMKDLGLAPNAWWSLAPGLIRPKSRGQLHFTGSRPSDGVLIEGNHLKDPDDQKAMTAAIELCRGLAASQALRPRIKRELLPGRMDASDLQSFVRQRTVTYWHQSCTAKMGRDDDSVVDSELKVYGMRNLRIADASIFPEITTGNTMAPSVIVGERAGGMIGNAQGLSSKPIVTGV